jgi:hypothetical protein
MGSFTINTEDPELIAQIKELREKAQSKQKQSPERLERAKARKFEAASRKLASALCDVHSKFDTKMTGKSEYKYTTEVEGHGFYEVTIAIRKRSRGAVVAQGDEVEVSSVLSAEIEALAFEALAQMDQKVSLPKQGFQEALASVEGYVPEMWAELKELLHKDPKSKSGRGTKFFPKKAKKSKKA